jgi:hypothetical protein
MQDSFKHFRTLAKIYLKKTHIAKIFGNSDGNSIDCIIFKQLFIVVVIMGCIVFVIVVPWIIFQIVGSRPEAPHQVCYAFIDFSNRQFSQLYLIFAHFSR